MKICDNEIKVINGKFDFHENGNEFIDYAHPYTFDLDVFGEGSLFQYLNRTCSTMGKSKLAKYLIKPSKDINRIISNQDAIQELRDKLDWRQDLQCIAYKAGESISDRDELLEWVNEPLYFLKRKIYRWVVIVLPLATALMLIFSILSVIPSEFLLLSLIINLGFVGFHVRRINTIHGKVSRKFKMLKKYASILRMIDEEDFKSDRLALLKEKLKVRNLLASENIDKLANIINGLDQRLNMLTAVLLNGLFLWDIIYSLRLERWQSTFKDEFPKWFSVIGEIDALSSLACYTYNNPENCFPEIRSKKFKLWAKELGHPLIPSDTRVNNDIRIENMGNFMIITGANMAGKSTWLRTVGINMILAMVGAPVCAQEFEFYPLEIYTSMRTLDSLAKNESYFYAELKRLQMIIKELTKGSQIFIILDEILKGTNSKDKHDGSKALLKQFIHLNTVGLIATHDIQLGELVNIFPENIKNYCFEVEIEGERLHFDYKLREGISKNLNATILMKKMGITI